MSNAVITVFGSKGFAGTYVLDSVNVIGRAGSSGCSIYLRSPLVSRRHGEIFLKNSEYFYRDTGSSNGSYINGRKITADSGAVALSDGDLLEFGTVTGEKHNSENVLVIFRKEYSASESWLVVPLSMHKEILVGTSRNSVIVPTDSSAEEKRLSFFCNSGEWLVTDHGSRYGTVLHSRKLTHPKYIKAPDSVKSGGMYFLYTENELYFCGGRLNTAGSSVGTKTLRPANDLKSAPSSAMRLVTTAKPIELTLSGAHIKNDSGNPPLTPPGKLTIESPARAYGRTPAKTPVTPVRPPVTPVRPTVAPVRPPVPGPVRTPVTPGIPPVIPGRPPVTPGMPPVTPGIPPVIPGRPTSVLQVNIKERTAGLKRTRLLKDINLTIYGGQMVLVLGGSGAGKTTLINAITGYEKAKAKITFNGIDIYDQYDDMKYEIGFVAQQDLVRASDSVYATLMNAAEMKLPINMPDEMREAKVNHVLNEFGLINERDKLVSKLSGGQKKRLSIAVEYISDPGLFILDEPDSGLDDAMGRGLMERLRAIANSGKIVMVITHSPERAADLFDRVIVLAKSVKTQCGHMAYYGSVKDTFRFFGTDCFSGILKRINRPDENGEGLSDYYIDRYAQIRRGLMV